MSARQGGQALVEWAASAMVLILFGFGLLAVGQVVSEYMVVRAAASQAAFAAARAPSEAAAQDAARQAVAGSQVRDFRLALDTHGFERGGMLTADASGCVDLGAFGLVSRVLGPCVPLRWTARALIEPYRSRTP